MTLRRAALLAGSLILPLGLMVLLFGVLGLTLGDLADTLARTPPWLLAAVVAITFVNQAISVTRWRAALRWLNPTADAGGWLPALEATTWGSFLGQVLPLQLAMTMARWQRSRTGTAVGATLYEQIFDLVALLSGAAAAAVLLVFHGSPQSAVALLVAAVVGACFSARWLFGAGRWAADRIASSGRRGSGSFAKLVEPLAQASRAPAGLLALMAGLAALRLAILALRAVLVAVVFVGALDWVTVTIGYPIVGLALGAPFLPAGMGAADWSLTGILLLAGAGAPAAALTAVALRVLNAFALGVLLIALQPFREKAASAVAIRAAGLPG